MKVTCAQPWLAADLGASHQVLSWCPYRPGLVLAERILWREVRNADLTEEFDAEAWLAEDPYVREGVFARTTVRPFRKTLP